MHDCLTKHIKKMEFKLPQLRYSFGALEPYIDAQTMEIHYTKHHGAYTDKLNAAVQGIDAAHMQIEEILSGISRFSADVRNNGGGFYNHSLFWEILNPEGGGEPGNELKHIINRDFGSFERMKELFNSAAQSRFGSGWAWLLKDADGKLIISSTPNQDNPLMDVAETRGKPILGLDVWEHAYYLKYQNRRPEYIQAFWNLVDWKEVEKKFHA